jgi:hypothetical protein
MSSIVRKPRSTFRQELNEDTARAMSLCRRLLHDGGTPKVLGLVVRPLELGTKAKTWREPLDRWAQISSARGDLAGLPVGP